MARILEKDGVDITNIDGAIFNRFLSGYRNGAIKSIGSECLLSILSTNSLQVGTGLLLICGFRVDIDETVAFNFTSLPSSETIYHVIAQIELDDEDQPTFTCFYQESSALTQNDLFSSSTTSRIYQIEIGQFVIDSSGIQSVTQTIETI